MYRAVYDITVTPKFDKPTSVGSRSVQKVQAMVPGPPDPPQIWTRRSRHGDGDGGLEDGEDEAVIEWSEPRLNGVKVAGYQVYVNDKKTGNVLGGNHRKAIIPLKGKRSVLVECLFPVTILLLSITEPCLRYPLHPECIDSFKLIIIDTNNWV